MHTEAYDFVAHVVATTSAGKASRVLDVGGRDVNGTVRPLFESAEAYHVLDIRPGPNVNIVADASMWEPVRGWYDVAVCTETFEHTRVWPAMVRMMARAVRPGGIVIVTAACDPRLPHSAVDGCDLRPGEHYENVHPARLVSVMSEALGTQSEAVVHLPRGDVYALGERR